MFVYSFAWVGFAMMALAATGDWSLVSTPNTSSTRINYLRDVACPSTSECWAVGNAQVGSVYQTLIERWNGASWSIVSSPSTSTSQGNLLDAVRCTSASDCWAAGYYDNTVTGAYQTLIEHWDGSSWTIVSSPNSDTTLENALYGLTCVSSNDCWAVGYHATLVSSETGLGVQTLIQRWDGTSWSIVSSPNTLPIDNDILASVTCSATNDCWAVGYNLTNGIFQTLTEHWDGSVWTVITSPNTSSSQNNLLKGISCASAANCWAVGSYDGDAATQTLIEHWDGTAWTIVASPNTDTTQSNFLSGVTCTSSSACWAAGDHYAPNGLGQVDRTLVENWDGSSWTIVTTPNTSDSEGNFLYKVTCPSAGDCWAIGSYLNSANKVQTLGLHYVALAPIPTSAVSRKIHGSAGTFDVDLPLVGDPGIECRSGDGTHQVVITFPVAVTVTDASVTPGPGGTASIVLAPGHLPPTEVVATLSNVSNAQTLTINLLGVSDGTASGDVHIPMGVLLGDADASKRTDAGDVTAVRNRTVSIPDQQTFRYDVNASGRIDAGDVTVTRNASVTVLP
jgi:hypothetical protein